MKNILSQSMKSIVAEDFRTARVFEKYSLDFCCRGAQTLGIACTKKGLDPASVAEELELTLENETQHDNRPESWAIDVLANHIVNVHHGYVRRSLPSLSTHVDKIASVHGLNHPELREIAQRFHSVADELTRHMQREEAVLFPYIRQLVHASSINTKLAAPPFGSIQNPIRMMEAEHQVAGDSLAFIRSASAGYSLPEDACSTYTVTFKELEEFELDLHRHVHLENNILFPKAIELEAEVIGSY